MKYKFIEITCVNGENNFSQMIADAVAKGQNEGYLLEDVKYSPVFDTEFNKVRSCALIKMYKSEI